MRTETQRIRRRQTGINKIAVVLGVIQSLRVSYGLCLLLSSITETGGTMPKSENQKLKLLYIIRILTEETDEKTPISTKDLIARLSEYNIAAERKTIYTDMECLRDFGYDIGFDGNRTKGGYYLASRDFELAELKMLVDMVGIQVLERKALAGADQQDRAAGRKAGSIGTAAFCVCGQPCQGGQ